MVRSGEHDPDAALAVRLRGALQQDVDRGSRIRHRFVGGEGQLAGIDEQVVVRDSEVDGPRTKRVLVGGLAHAHSCHRAEHVAKRRRVRARSAVLNDDDRGVEFGRQRGQDLSQHLEAAPRRADRCEVVPARARHLTFRYSFSRASSSS